MPSLAQLIERIGVPINNPQLIKAAVTHRSFRNERHLEPDLESNERLEFLGDAILSFCATRLIFQRFPTFSEGQMTEIRAALVRASALADLARSFDLGAFLRLSRGEESSGARTREALLADTFEALLGAIFLDGGLAAVEQFLLPLLEQRLEGVDPNDLLDARSVLQERVQSERGITPRYTTIATRGPEHRRAYTVAVYAGEQLLGVGEGLGKQAAAQVAARVALAHLKHPAADSAEQHQ